MLSDARELANDQQVEADVCIIGAGPAGISIARELIGNGARVWLMEGNFHHLGATRMHTDPSMGVVDTDCRVHGVRNLYVAGSSVFPTYGCSNPTLTVVALALRLADHLKKQLAS